jgi:hypothetical protein
MPMRDEVLPKLLAKTEPFAEKLANDTADEHDIFPALLWLLLKSDEAFNQSIESLRQSRLADQEVAKLSLERVESALNNSLQAATSASQDDNRTLSKAIDKLQQAIDKDRDALLEFVKQATEYLAKKNQDSIDQVARQLRKVLLVLGIAVGLSGIVIALLIFQLLRF